MKSRAARVVDRIVETLLRGSSKIAPRRRGIYVDSFVAHGGWFPFSRLELARACARVRVDLTNVTLVSSLIPDMPVKRQLVDAFLSRNEFQGINLYDAVATAVSISLEKLPFELDPSDQKDLVAISSWCQFALFASAEVDRILHKHKPDFTVYIQGYFPESRLLYQKAQKYGLECVAWEIALVADRLRISKRGGDAVFHPRLHDGYTESDVANCGTGSMKSTVDFPKHLHHQSGARIFSWPEAKFRVTYLSQVYTDSSQINVSSLRCNPQTVLREVLEAGRRSRAHTLIKIHPKELIGASLFGRPLSCLTLRKLLANGFPWDYRLGDDFSLDTSAAFDTRSALQTSDLVISINSQGLLEAAALGREAAIISEGYFSDLDVFWRPKSADEIVEIIAQISRGERKANAVSVASSLHAHLQLDCVNANAMDFIRRVAF